MDTCVCLDLGKDIFNTKILNKLTEFIEHRKVSIILPKLIISEWNKHKIEKISIDIKKSINRKFKNIIELGKFVDYEEQGIINKILSLEETIKENIDIKSNNIIASIEYLFNYESTKRIFINNEVMSKVIVLGLEKKAPFHKKSSMADALIILSATNYMKVHNLTPSIFITHNSGDYNSSENNKLIHNDLVHIAREIKMNYYINIGEALNHIETNSISNDEIDRIDSLKKDIFCMKCCSHITVGAWLRSRYGGLTWQYSCPECKYIIDTGERYE